MNTTNIIYTLFFKSIQIEMTHPLVSNNLISCLQQVLISHVFNLEFIKPMEDKKLKNYLDNCDIPNDSNIIICRAILIYAMT